MKRIGKQTLEVEKDCYIIGKSSIVGEKEKRGTFCDYIDVYVADDKLGENTFEKAERKNMKDCWNLSQNVV